VLLRNQEQQVAPSFRPDGGIVRLGGVGVNWALSDHRLPRPLAEPLTKGDPAAFIDMNLPW
jgi:hypothetical protein